MSPHQSSAEANDELTVLHGAACEGHVKQLGTALSSQLTAHAHNAIDGASIGADLWFNCATKFNAISTQPTWWSR